MARVYSTLTIIELEKQYDASKDNLETLLSLDNELSHRGRKRAKSLHVEIKRRINELTENDQGPVTAPQDDLFSQNDQKVPMKFPAPKPVKYRIVLWSSLTAVVAFGLCTACFIVLNGGAEPWHWFKLAMVFSTIGTLALFAFALAVIVRITEHFNRKAAARRADTGDKFT